MKTPPDCVPCIIKQGLNAAKLSTDDTGLQRRIVDSIMENLKGRLLDKSPAIHSNLGYRTARDITGVSDPYHDLKKKYNRIALNMYQDLKKRIETSSDRLHTAIKLAVAGNVIDLGIGNPFDLKKDIDSVLNNNLARDDYGRFRKDLGNARDILYIGDNTGEIVFDKLLIEEIQRFRPSSKISFVVKSGPIINDATIEDASEVGIDKIAKILTTGSDSIGVDWDKTPDDFRKEFSRADIIISKGQGNFECLDERPENIYFILRAKCPCVAEHLKVNFNDSVFLGPAR